MKKNSYMQPCYIVISCVEAEVVKSTHLSQRSHNTVLNKTELRIKLQKFDCV